VPCGCLGVGHTLILSLLKNICVMINKTSLVYHTKSAAVNQANRFSASIFVSQTILTVFIATEEVEIISGLIPIHLSF
jgi:hypothetical protein